LNGRKQGEDMESVRQGREESVVIAGQMPPPVGGQNLNVQRVFALLEKSGKYRVLHWRFAFTRDTRGFGAAGFGKILELFRVIGRLIAIRRRGPIGAILYPVGGPHFVPAVRDILLVPCALLSARRVYLHFRAAGLKEYLEECPGWLAFLLRKVYAKAYCGVVLTDFGKRDPEAAGLERTFVLPNGLEDDAGDESAVEAVDSGEDKASAVVRILSVGHLCAAKGSPELIAAFGELARENKEVELHLVGEPARELSAEKLEELCLETGVRKRIVLHGLKNGDELWGIYRQCDFFVFSTVAPYESFGMVLIEAMRFSLPIVVTDWRGNLEVCGRDFGGVVAENPAADLQGSLRDALVEAVASREKWPAWSRENRRRYETTYTIGQLSENLDQLFEFSLARPTAK
jgi:glycosyltransferase involved in cell wall biosynthesis